MSWESPHYANTYPCPILTKFLYSLVGSASVHIACKRLIISSSLVLSFCLFLGVATPEILAKFVWAELGGGSDRWPSAVLVTCCWPLSVRSVADEPGESLDGCLCKFAPCSLIVDTVTAEAGDRLSRVVLARPSTSVGLEGRLEIRCEVDRSKVGVAMEGGVGAGR